MRIDEDYARPAGVHSFQKVDGILALDLSEVILDEKLAEGDHISWFSLPGGKQLVCKNPNGVLIKRLTSSYIYLDAEITLEEK